MDITKYGIWFFYDGMTAPQSAEFRKPFEKLGVSINVEAGSQQTLELKPIDAQKPPPRAGSR